MSEQSIQIPGGQFDDRDTRQSEVPFKPLKDIDIEGLGRYSLGVPGDFSGNAFGLVARDPDGYDIPLFTVKKLVGRDGKVVFVPEKNEGAVGFFGDKVDLDDLFEQFGPELDSFIQAQGL